MRLLKPEEVAARFGVSLWTVLRWLREKRVPAVKVNGRWRVPEDELEKAVAAWREAGNERSA